jgi:hypothetical protein
LNFYRSGFVRFMLRMLDGVGLLAAPFGYMPTALGFPCFTFGLLASPVCCMPTALAFPCFAFGLLASLSGCLPAVLAFPCFAFGLLASPLCGAALTFFAAAKKVSKESGLPTVSQ